MFYCQPCATEREWPETMSQSLGTCEVCGQRARCNDRPARLLPEQRKDASPDDSDHNWRMFCALTGGALP